MATPNTTGFDAFERLSGSLEGFAAENGHFRAMCPVHGGHRPALTIAVEGEPPNRKILLHCHAECGKQEILDALGLEKKDLFERPRTKDSKKLGPIVATYDYVDLAGALVTQTTRHYPPKDFRQRRPDGNGGWIWSIKGIEPVLYNLPAVTRTILDGGTVFVVEGEKDCDRANEVLKEAGVFTTCPMGSKKWRGSYTQILRGANVVLIPDNDGPGKEHISQIGSALLPVARSVKVLELPGVPDDGGDLSDWLNAGGTAEAFETLVKESLKIPPPSPPPLRGDGDGGGMQGRVLWFQDLPEPPPQEFIANPAMPKAFPTVIHGAGGAAKSTLALDFAVRYTNLGGSWLGNPLSGKGKVLVVDFELNNQVFTSRVRKLARGMGLNPNQLQGLAYYEVGSTPTYEALRDVYEACKEHGFDVVIIDSVGPALEGDASTSKDVIQFHRNHIAPLTTLGVSPLLIDHQARSYGEEDYQFKGAFGSSYKDNLVRSIFQVQPKASEEDSDTLVVRMRHKKANFTKKMKPFDVWFTFGEDSTLVSRQDVEDSELLTESAVSLESRVLAALRHHGTGTIAALSEWLSAKSGSVGNTVRDLKKAGRVVEVGKEGNAHVYGLTDSPPSPPPLREHGDGGVHNFEASVRNREDVKSCADRTNGDLFKPDSHIGSEFDLNKSKAPVETVEGLDLLVESLQAADKVALDLETMPPEGWGREFVREYKTWRRSLKTKPPADRRRKKWADLKEKTYKRYATDVETARVRLVSLATHEGLNEVVDASRVDVVPLLDVLKDKTLVTHNGAFDLGILRERYGYVHGGKVLDTQLLYLLHHYAEDGDRSQLSGGKWRVPDPLTTKIDFYGTGKKTVGMSALNVVAERYLGVSLDKGNQASDWSVPNLTPEQVSYALMDTKVLLDLFATLTQKLEALGMGAVVDLESRAFAAQIDMQLTGFPADVETAEKMAERYRVESEEALKEANALLPQETNPEGGVAWNWNKAEDIRAVLRLLGAPIDQKGYPKTEKTGEPSTSTAALTTIEDPEPAARWVASYLRYLGIHKRYRDFASKYAGLIKEGRIRGRFATISTGRLNCQKPNLQQVPKRGHLQTLEGMRIRDIFRPKEGDVFVVADFAQVELLLAATLAQRATGMEGHMLRVFEDARVDIHTETAASMLKKPVEDVVKEERTLAKAVNFGLIYGAEAETLLEYARNNYGVKDMSLADARRYRTAFFERYPELAQWHRIVERGCNLGDGFSVTPLGRRRKLPKWASSKAIASTTAKNSPVQGAGADAIKLTLARLFEDRHNCPGNPRLNCCIHDEVVLSVAEEHKEAAVLWVKEHMAAAEREAVGDPKSPIVIDVEAKHSWGG